MKRFFFLAALALSLGACADRNAEPFHTYEANDLTLAVGNSARMGCSCMFVMEMPEAYCRAWVKASPDVAMSDSSADMSLLYSKICSDDEVSWKTSAAPRNPACARTSCFGTLSESPPEWLQADPC
jgi:hypothetical protein